MKKFLLLLLAALLAGEAFPQRRFVEALRSGRKQTVVTYGTSLTDSPRGWPALLKDSIDALYPGAVEVVNSARAAMWSTWGVQHLDERVLAQRPDLVLIEFAINDAYLPYRTSTEVCRINLEYMIDRIREACPACEIVLQVMNMPYTEMERPQLERYCDVYRKVARRRRLKLIDHSTYWRAIHAAGEEEFRKWVPDGLHPGEKAWTTYVVPYIIRELGIK